MEKEKEQKVREEFRFTLPRGSGVSVERGRKVSGVMRLVKVKDLVQIERDGEVQRKSGAFYVVLLSRVVVELGQEKMINRRVIEGLEVEDFAFLVDLLHRINHQVIREVPLRCGGCGHMYKGVFRQLGEV